MEPLGTTLTQHIRAAERRHPGATGEFSMLLSDLATAAKVISREVNRAGILEEILGLAGRTNVQGEEVQKLDEYANDTLVRVLGRSGHVAVMASEEVADPIPVPPELPCGRYAVLFDPLDGSSNIDVNASIGTIFSIRKRPGEGSDSFPAAAAASRDPNAPPRTGGRAGALRDLVGPGSEQVAAGYVIYGSSTVLVYTARSGVHAFTLDPSVGEFLLSSENLRIPATGRTYSVNEGNSALWDEPTRRLVAWYKEPDPATKRPYGHRYIGSLVADFHRTLLKGGIFLYPADRKAPEGKLRYLYEAAPLALVCEEAGGAASDGRGRILERVPLALHARTPLLIGSRDEVARAVRFLEGPGPERAL